jgi:TusE/DsrC/DsvC family sulfur relay protein
MSLRTYAGKSVSISDEGFLLNASEWTPAVAEEIAKESGITPLSEKHWQVITFCREDAAREGQPPGVRRIAKLSGVEMKELYQLFPKGPGKLASRIAGLPKPQGCI